MKNYREILNENRAWVEEIFKKVEAKMSRVTLRSRDKLADGVDADGVHIGQSDMTYEDARRLLGPDKIIGLSVESFEDIEAANALDVDYIGISPVYGTPTKTDTAEPFGLEGLRKAVEMSVHPTVAIGGMNASTIGEVMAAGTDGVAVVSAICSAENIPKATSELRMIVDSYARMSWSKEVWKKSASAHLPSDSTVNCFEALSPDTTKSLMLRLEAISELNNEILSTNTYFLWGNESSKELASIDIAKVDVNIMHKPTIQVVLTNTSDTPAMMIRLNLCGDDGEQILPVKYSDNYFHLLPGERKTININWKPFDARGTNPQLKISGYNVKEFVF